MNQLLQSYNYVEHHQVIINPLNSQAKKGKDKTQADIVYRYGVHTHGKFHDQSLPSYRLSKT